MPHHRFSNAPPKPEPGAGAVKWNTWWLSTLRLARSWWRLPRPHYDALFFDPTDASRYQAWLELFGNGGSCLVLGSGVSHLPRVLRLLGWRATAVDISEVALKIAQEGPLFRSHLQNWFPFQELPESLEQAWRALQQSGSVDPDRTYAQSLVGATLDQTEVVYVADDARRTQFHPESFDLVIADHFFECIPPGETLALGRKLMEWLRPGGCLLVEWQEDLPVGNMLSSRSRLSDLTTTWTSGGHEFYMSSTLNLMQAHLRDAKAHPGFPDYRKRVDVREFDRWHPNLSALFQRQHDAFQSSFLSEAPAQVARRGGGAKLLVVDTRVCQPPTRRPGQGLGDIAK